MMVRVVTAAQAAARDAAAIAAGIASRTLMQRAGAAAAEMVTRRFRSRVGDGVRVFAGPGNNGGDAWVVARLLAQSGCRVTVTDVGPSTTADARAERAAALGSIALADVAGDPAAVVIDGLLGTGARGAPEGAILEAVNRINAMRRAGAVVVALDVPTGLDASTGAADVGVTADLTVTFGTVKRGLLLARGRAGAIAVVDIGLGVHADLDDGAPQLVDEAWVAERVPPITAESHKGTRRRVAIVGGARGMAGATVLAARAAMRSGVGMVRLVVAAESLKSVQSAAVEATATSWPLPDDELMRQVVDYADAALVGPGLGQSVESRALLDRILDLSRCPVVLDADALTHYAGAVPELARRLRGRSAVITPHAGEFARLVGVDVGDVNMRRFDAGRELAHELGAVVLLKGVPTVVSAPNGECLVSASGTAALAAAGSGDVLGGLVVTLLAQTENPLTSAACAAWVHGRAAEIANEGRPVRGVALEDVVVALREGWRFAAREPTPPLLAWIEAPPGDRRQETGDREG